MAKNTFASKTFAANTFASGTWSGVAEAVFNVVRSVRRNVVAIGARRRTVAEETRRKDTVVRS